MNSLIRKLLPKRADARIEALSSCIDHLELEWTDNDLEKEEAKKVIGYLQKIIDKIFKLSRQPSKSSSSKKINRYIPLTEDEIDELVQECPDGSTPQFWYEDEVLRITDEHFKKWKSKQSDA